MVITEEDSVRLLVNSSKEFEKKFVDSISTSEKNNFIASSFSAATAVAMLSIGANEDTKSEMETYLCFQKDQDIFPGFQKVLKDLNNISEKNLEIKVANRIFIDENYVIRPEFLRKNIDVFAAEPVTVNFADAEKARSEINKWVKEKTKKIKELLKNGMIKNDTKLVLVNAMYLKAKWLKEFNPHRTSQENFYVERKEHVKVEMMHQKVNFRICNPQGIDATVLEMPYVGNRLSMVILLPNEFFGISKLEEDLKTFDSEFTFSASSLVDLTLPKFKIRSSIDLKMHLQRLGMKKMFDVGNFTGIANDPLLVVSEAVQECYVEVDEIGTEAGAATALTEKRMASKPQPSKEFKVNHPFIFCIRDNKTGITLFYGKVTNPNV